MRSLFARTRFGTLVVCRALFGVCATGHRHTGTSGRGRTDFAEAAMHDQHGVRHEGTEWQVIEHLAWGMLRTASGVMLHVACDDGHRVAGGRTPGSQHRMQQKIVTKGRGQPNNRAVVRNTYGVGKFVHARAVGVSELGLTLLFEAVLRVRPARFVVAAHQPDPLGVAHLECEQQQDDLDRMRPVQLFTKV